MSSDLATRRLWIGIPGPDLDTETVELLRSVRPGGVVLFRRNVRSLTQVRGLIADLRDLLGDGLILSVDHEGGLVTRFHQELTVFPGNMALGAAAFREPSMGEHLAEEQGLHSAQELRDLGFDVNLAPVLDLASSGENPGITIRSFGEAPELASALGAALVRGTLKGGIYPTLKHFPGKGNARVDAHLDLPRIPVEDQGPHLLPFRRCLGEGASIVMTSHVVFDALDPQLPVTLSPSVVQGVLRGDLGFRGVVVSDDLEMGAMQRNYGFDETVRGACNAGHDALCIAHQGSLHRRAAEILRRGLADREPWFGNPEDVEAHLGALSKRLPAAPPDRDRAQSVADAIAGRAITVLRDDKRLLPLTPGARVVVAMPVMRSETQVENPLRGEEDGSVLTEALGPNVRVVTLPTEPTPADVDRLLVDAQDADRLLVVTTNGRFLKGQAQLAQRAAAEHPRSILLFIRSPFDGEVIPASLPATMVASFGFRPTQLRALARVLRGEVQPYGRCPVTLRSTT